MNKNMSQSFRLFFSFSVLLLAAPRLPAQIQYYPGNFDLEITFGCNCSCFCPTNLYVTNAPVGGFLATNGVQSVSGSAVLAASATPGQEQYVPQHWALLYPGYPSLGFEGWTATETVPANVAGMHGTGGLTYTSPRNFSNPIFPYPVVPFNYYEAPLDPLTTAFTGVGLNVDLPSPFPPPVKQPYPWDVNATLILQNGQLYAMEQQLVTGPYPPYWGETVGVNYFETPVTYVETNSLLTISLYCTNGGQTNLLYVSYPTITATLLPNPVGNVPLPLNDVTPDGPGYELWTPDLFSNWTWPLAPTDTPDLSGTIPGAAYTIQASLPNGPNHWTGYVFGPAPVDYVPLLVRANRAYRITLQYALTNDCTGAPYVFMNPLIIANTGLVPACTNMQLVFYTGICSACTTNPTYCPATNTGSVDMLGTPNVWPVPPDSITSGITLWASGDNNTFDQNLPGSTVPETFHLGVVTSSSQNNVYFKWATENLGLFGNYEYFSSPYLYPVYEPLCGLNDLSNIFVMCPTNPGIVQGNVMLTGPVSPNYYGGQAALSFLQFAVYNNTINPGLPYDPNTNTVSCNTPWSLSLPYGYADPQLLNVSTIQATGGASSTPAQFTYGHGHAVTEFDNPPTPGFYGPNNYAGHYSLQLAGLQSQPSSWNANDLHLVFGCPVNLTYDIIETNPQYNNVNITCGTNVVNNITNCFGLLTVNVVNEFYPLEVYTGVSIQVSGSGPGYTVPSFSVTYSGTTPNNASIPLFLPQGTYTVTAVVTAYIPSINEYETLYPPTTSYTVLCDQTNGPVPCTNSPVILTNAIYSSPCTNNSGVVVISGSVLSGTAVVLTYSLDGQPVVLVTLPGNQYSFLLTLSSGSHILTLTATDSNGCTSALTEIVNTAGVSPCPMPFTTNKTVQCGSLWGFDPPPAYTPCCGTNVVVAVANTVTSGICPQFITRTWQVTNCCGTATNVSQLVTVVNNLPPIFNVRCVTNVYFAGGSNSFTTPVPSSPSANLLSRMQAAGITTFKEFDQCLINSYLIHTFTNLPPCITSATLTMGLQPCGDNSANDTVNLSFTGAGGVLLSTNAYWSSYIGSGNGSPGLVGNTWDTSTYPNGQIITEDLGTLDLIASMNQYGFLDFISQDDSGVDFLQLTVVSCCCSTNKTVPCGSNWNFDFPSAMDACSGAPVPATILSTLTNGLCPQVITRTWAFTDVCSNTAFCSQTVTVSCCTNCCTNCTPANYISYTNVITHGYNFLADNLCQGTNNSVNSVLTNLVSDPNGVLNTQLDYWNGSGFNVYSYFNAADAAAYFVASSGSGWYDASGNLVSLMLSAGQGFVLNNPGTNFNLVIQGCLPTCPPPCSPPTNGQSSLVGRLGLGTATWTNLFSCPPPCGAQILLWNGAGYAAYNYANGVWTPSLPVLAAGQSAFVSVQPNTNCCSTVMSCPSNIVVSACTSVPVLYTVTASNLCCATNLVVVCSPTNGSYFAPGTVTTVNCFAVDCNGITNSCSFSVTVQTAQSDFQNGSFNTAVPSNGTGGGWTSSDINTIVGGWGASIGNPGGGFLLNEVGSLGENPTIQQTICCLQTGQCYTVHWQAQVQYYGSNPSNAPSFGVLLDGHFIDLLNVGPNDYAWHQFSTSFTATNSCQTLGFAAEVDPTDVSYYLDNVWLEPCGCFRFNCQSNLLVHTCTSNAIVNFTITATNLCGTNAVNVTSTPASGSSFPVGTTTVTNIAQDSAGHLTLCTFTVTVVSDYRPLVITSYPTNMVICVGTNGCGAMINVTNNVLIQGGNQGFNIIQSIPPGTILCSNTPVTFTVSDRCGNTNVLHAQAILETCCVAPPLSMVLWMTFDESVGVTCLNSAGYHNGLRYEGSAYANNGNGPTRTFGQYVNNCLCFNGASNKVVVADYPQINFSTNSFSMDAWVNWRGGLGFEVLLDKRTNIATYTYGYHWFLNSGASGVQLATGQGPSGPYNNFWSHVTLTPNTWNHLAVTVQRGATNGLKFYLNGTLTDTFSTTSVTNSMFNTNDLWIGASPLPGNFPFNGCLDELELFSRALTAAEVNGIYQTRTVGKCRPTASVPALANFCYATNLTVTATVCNSGATPLTLNVTFAGLSASQVGGSGVVNGPTSFTGYPAAVTLSPNTCTNFPVTIGLPPGLTSATTAYYTMTVQDAAGQVFEAIGKVTDGTTSYLSLACAIINPYTSGQVAWQAPTNFTFTLVNTSNGPVPLNPQIFVVNPDLTLETNLVSLNGLPPGTPVTNSIVLSPLGSYTETIAINYADAAPWRPYYLVLALDIGNAGSLVQVASAPFAQIVPSDERPLLGAALGGGQVIVNWDLVNTGWTLDSTLNLLNTSWTPAGIPVVLLPDGSQGVSLPATNAAQFFRLRR